MRLAVCIPSRGLLHSRTVDDILQNLEGWLPGAWLIFSHGQSQPEAQNYLVKKALATEPDYIWFVDDDMQLPRGLLNEMFITRADIVVADYPVTARGDNAVHIRDGKFESAGMGCVLIKPKVFRKLEEPYFRADTNYVWETDHLQPYPRAVDKPLASRHGGHDVDFFQRLLKAGVEPAIVKTTAGQYHLVKPELPKYGNHTQYEVETWHL